MTPASGAALFAAAVVGGITNAIAGGGTFIVFPTLLLAGVPAIQANATNTMALWPGVVFSLFAVRRETAKAQHKGLLALTSLAGGAAGALLLLRTPPALFELAVPFLLLGATLMFAFNPLLAKRLMAIHEPSRLSPARIGVTAVVIFAIAVYGGYFGGGIGILFLAALGLLGLTDYHEMNVFRLLLSCSSNATAVLVFVASNAIAWPEASLMLVGSIAGGYGAARVMGRIPGHILRRVVIALGLAMSAYFFVRRFA